MLQLEPSHQRTFDFAKSLAAQQVLAQRRELEFRIGGFGLTHKKRFCPFRLSSKSQFADDRSNESFVSRRYVACGHARGEVCKPDAC